MSGQDTPAGGKYELLAGVMHTAEKVFRTGDIVTLTEEQATRLANVVRKVTGRGQKPAPEPPVEPPVEVKDPPAEPPAEPPAAATS